jgi:single-stranded-DNA-specific exonuclease
VALEDRDGSSLLADTLRVPHLIAHLLMLRGAGTEDTAKRFLDPSLDHLSDPFLLADMDRAIARLAQARERGERVLVFGDYDVDGIAGTAILIHALRRYGIAECTYGMPQRLVEGYGLAEDHVDQAHSQGVTLIITVDNGVAAHPALERARTRGIDVIVTDHHPLDAGPPDAFALINPKRHAPDYPGWDACGACVAFRLAWALTGEQADLDLVALATVADIVPLRGENRDLVAVGLDAMRRNPRPGLAKLAQVAGVALPTLRAEDLAFQLGPRINAGGRMGDGLDGLHLLLAESEREVGGLADELDAANDQRRELEQATFEEAVDQLERTHDPSRRAIVLASRSWHAGVVGIVASRIQSRYYRPVVLIAVNGDGTGRGSARSVERFNVAEALHACDAHLVACGGHTAAAGLTVREEKIEAFREAFEAAVAQRLPEGEPTRPLAIDAQASISEIDGRLVSLLDRLQPFGTGNPSPVLCTYGVRVQPGSVRELRGGHIKFVVGDRTRILDVIGFRMADRLDSVTSAGTVDIAYSPQFNTWRGETVVQLVLKDVRKAR